MKKGKKGFTLIELIIVVIILGVLGAIAVPAYLNAVERSRIGKARSALTNVIKAEKMYAADHSGTYLDPVTAANLSAACTGSNTLNCYVEMADISADTDWGYSYAAGVATATRAAGGAYPNTTITLSTAGVWGGTHPLR